MRTPHMKRFGLSVIMALVLGLFALGTPAHADTPVLTVSTDKPTATPGSSVTLTLTFTNVHDSEVRFVYQSIQPTYPTTQVTGLKYAFSSCGGSVTGCDTGLTSGLVHQSVPVAAGASTTVTLTYDIATDSACGARIDFYSYLYYEFQSGAASDSGIYGVPGNEVVCS